MYGGGVSFDWSDMFIVLLVLTVPAQVALAVGALSGFCLSGMRLLPGAFVGLVVGTVADFGLIWFLFGQFQTDTIYSVPWRITIGVCAVATFGICWWIHWRGVKKERLPQIDAPLGCT